MKTNFLMASVVVPSIIAFAALSLTGAGRAAPLVVDGGADAGVDPSRLQQMVNLINNRVSGGQFYILVDRNNAGNYGLVFVNGTTDPTTRRFYSRSVPSGFQIVSENLTEANFVDTVNNFLGNYWNVYVQP